MISAILLGLLFAGSLAWYWANMPGGDFVQFLQSVFTYDIRVDLIAVPVDRFALVISSLVLSAMVVMVVMFSGGVIVGILFKDSDFSIAMSESDVTAFGLVLTGIPILIFTLPVASLIAGTVSQDIVHFIVTLGLEILAWFGGLVILLGIFSAINFDEEGAQRHRHGSVSKLSPPKIALLAVVIGIGGSIWLLTKSPPFLPTEVQIGRLERTLDAQELQATQAPLATATARALQSTLEALSLRVGAQAESELATLEIIATGTAAARPLIQPTENLSATISALRQAPPSPPPSDSILNIDRIIAIIGIVSATIIGIIQIRQRPR